MLIVFSLRILFSTFINQPMIPTKCKWTVFNSTMPFQCRSQLEYYMWRLSFWGEFIKFEAQICSGARGGFQISSYLLFCLYFRLEIYFVLQFLILYLDSLIFVTLVLENLWFFFNFSLLLCICHLTSL